MIAAFVVVGSVIGFTSASALCVWLFKANERLAHRNDRLDDHVVILQGAVAEAREVFFRYADIHAVKGTGEGDKKALTNRQYGHAMNRALKETNYHELGPLQQAFVNMGRQIARNRERDLG